MYSSQLRKGTGRPKKGFCEPMSSFELLYQSLSYFCLSSTKKFQSGHLFTAFWLLFSWGPHMGLSSASFKTAVVSLTLRKQLHYREWGHWLDSTKAKPKRQFQCCVVRISWARDRGSCWASGSGLSGPTHRDLSLLPPLPFFSQPAPPIF